MGIQIERRDTLMSDYEILSVIFMVINIIVILLIAYINQMKK